MSHSNLPSSHSPQRNSRVGLVSVIVIGAMGLALVIAYFLVSFDSNRISLSQPTAEVEVDAPTESNGATELKEAPESEVTLESEEETDTVVENELEIAEVATTESTTETLDTQDAEGESPSDLDIVRVEPDGSTLIAGNADPNAQIRIMSGNTVLGETFADQSGAFAVLLDDQLPPGSHELTIYRNGVLSEDTIGVFVPARDSDQQPLVIVSKEGDATEILQLPESSEQDSPTAEVLPSIDEIDTDDETSEYELSIRAVEAEDGKVYVAGEATPDLVVNIYIENSFIGAEKSDSNSRWLLEADKQLQPGTHNVRADLIDETDGKVLQRVAVDFHKEQGLEIARPVVSQGDNTDSDEDYTAAPGTSAPKAIIIRPGDNLWNISRRLYGDGFRYTTIYQANRDQIVDPDLIFPEQKFITPVIDE